MQALRKDGAEITVELSLSAIRIQEAWHAVGNLRDITEQNRAIEALAQARRLDGRSMDSVPDAVYFKDADSRFLRISRAQAEDSQLNGPEEAVGKTDFDFFSEVHARPAFEDEREIMRTGRPLVGLEEQETFSDGRIAWVSTTKVPLRGEQGKIIGTFGISRDITGQKRAEEALRASYQIIEGIIDAIPVRVFWKDRNLVFLGCNAAFARDAGFADPKDVIGKTDFQMSWRAQAELYRRADRQVIESGCPQPLVEEPQTTPDGKTITLLTSKIPL